MGNNDLGWELYESRWLTPEFKSKVRNFSAPLWLGKNSLKNKTILIHSEQGLGDSLQFCRYINLFQNLSCTVLLEVEGQLLTIMRNLLPKENIFRKGAQLPEFDYHCPMMSLPLALGKIIPSIPCSAPYIKICEEIKPYTLTLISEFQDGKYLVDEMFNETLDSEDALNKLEEFFK